MKQLIKALYVGRLEGTERLSSRIERIKQRGWNPAEKRFNYKSVTELHQDYQFELQEVTKTMAPETLPDLENAFYRALSTDIQTRVIDQLHATPPTSVIENVNRLHHLLPPMDFPSFSCYMGTPTNLQLTVSPADFSKFLLPSRTSATGSYVDHKISILPIFDVGNFMKTVTDMQSSGDDPPLLDRPFDFISSFRFVPKDFFSLLVCTSADDSTGLPPEQGLFSFVNHTISDVGRFMKFTVHLHGSYISRVICSTIHLTYC